MSTLIILSSSHNYIYIERERVYVWGVINLSLYFTNLQIKSIILKPNPSSFCQIGPDLDVKILDVELESDTMGLRFWHGF